MTVKKTRPRRPGQLPPGRHGLSREEVTASQRDRLTAAVIDAVADKGYERTSVADVLARAGVSRRTYYEHFDDLGDCFLVAYDREVRLVGTIVEEAYEAASGGAWADQVRAGLRALTRHLASRPAAARVLTVEVLGSGPTGVARRDAALRGYTYFIDAGRGGADHEVPGRTAIALLGAINELVAGEVLRGAAEGLEEITPDLVYLICLPFLGRERALAARDRSAAEPAHAA